MSTQDHCYHTFSRWTGTEVLCAVCSKHIGFKEPPNHQGLLFVTEKYELWLHGFPRLIATTMTIGRTNEDLDIAL